MSDTQFQNTITEHAVIGRALGDVYDRDDQAVQKSARRFSDLVAVYLKHFGNDDLNLFSTPGRTEISGNHTDHNHGRVLAASIDLDSIAVAGKTSDDTITISSDGYSDLFKVNLNELQPDKNERRTTTSLIRGIAARFKQLGYAIGGFNACISSQVLPGSGLSSSASIEVLIGSIFNTLYNADRVSPVEIARIGQFAENEYFDKPCGLMDQLACAVGGVVAIDFNDPDEPVIQCVDFDFGKIDSTLLVVDTGGNHTDLTDEYAAVPIEMKAVAKNLGRSVLRDVKLDDLIEKIGALRSQVGDRAILRALHFTQENERVEKQVQALQQNDFEIFLRLVNDSGKSSCCWLQNCFTTSNVKQQGVMLGLALTKMFLDNNTKGACRIHGGGFAGTILVFMPTDKLDAYVRLMESVFGADCVVKLKIRRQGTISLGQLNI